LKPAQRLLTDLPSTKIRLSLLKLAVERLSAAGYLCLGTDYFAKPRDPLAKAQARGVLHRNFQGYTTCAEADVHAFGMSSISQVDATYWQNKKDLDAYYAALDAGRLPVARGFILTPEDQVRRTTIIRLMCDMKLDFGAMSELLGIHFASHFSKEIRSLHDLAQDGLLTLAAGGFEVTPIGRLLIRNIATRFDATRPAAARAPRALRVQPAASV
jgi:oxygen-independent coproporphyrinogen-3 oxidase